MTELHKVTITGIATEEGTFTTSDGKTLYTKTWKASNTNESPKALLVFVHGFSDHCNTYGDFFHSLATRGIQVYSWDQRGWGRSVKSQQDKGWTGPTSLVVKDLTDFIKHVLQTGPADVPVFVMGHSMGGAEVLTYMASGPPDVLSRIRGWLLESPFLLLHKASQPNPIVVVVGRLAGKLLPQKQLVQELDGRLLSRDQQVGQDFTADELCHNTGTLEGLAGMLDRAASLENGKMRIPADAGEGGRTRVWLSHGTEDGICDYHGSERLYKYWDDIQDKEYLRLEGWYHRLHSEPSPGKEKFVDAVVKWVSDRSGPLTSAVGSKL